MTDSLDGLRGSILQAHGRLARHPLFSSLQTIEDLQGFMEWHVFAVWDFVSLLKRLQRDLTCVTLPWTPPANPNAARIINEIVLGEESDVMPDGSSLSHFELYLGAMREVGAETNRVEGFVRSLRDGIALEAALARAEMPAPVASFVRSTLQTAMQGDLDQVLGSFFFGRENVIPEMFKGLLDRWGLSKKQAPLFVHYLKRHIDLDGDAHGPAAQSLVDELVGDDSRRLEALLTSALAALRQRDQMWNALHLSLDREPALLMAQ